MYAIIEDGIVVNRVKADAAWAVANGAVACSDEVQIGWSYTGGVFSAPVAPVVDLATLKAQFVKTIDDDVAAVTGRFTRFQAEYEKREAAARAFVVNEYVGDPGIWVTGFAQPAGLPYNVAANLIITQADQLRGALEALGALRMEKYNIMKSVNADTTKAVFDSIRSQIQVIAAAL